MGDFGVAKDKWVCPNDRELSLRAKLKVGWSVKTNSNNFNKPDQLNDAEQEIIMNVIRKAEMLDKGEQERVGRLVERLDNMKKNAMGNGTTQCILCADEFGLLGASPLLCNDCRKKILCSIKIRKHGETFEAKYFQKVAVCTKCGVDTLSAQKEPLWLCKICAETREIWKKSGAWFYKGLPKYVLPGKKTEPSKYSSAPSTPSRNSDYGTGSPVRPFNSWLQSKGRSGSEREYTDSSDEEFKSTRLMKRGTVRKPYVEPGDSLDSPAASPYSVAPPEPSSQGPSPTHLYSPTPDSPRSPYRDPSDKSPGYEVSPTHSKDRRIDSDRSHTPTAGGSHWYKPTSKRETMEEEEYAERSFRTQARRECQSSPSNRNRQIVQNREEESFDEKPSPEESSKKRNRFYKYKKRKKH